MGHFISSFCTWEHSSWENSSAPASVVVSFDAADKISNRLVLRHLKNVTKDIILGQMVTDNNSGLLRQ